MPTSAAAVQAPVAEASTHLMLDLPRLNWLWRSGTRQTSMPWAASVSYRPGSPRSGSPSHLTQPVNVARSIRRSALSMGARRVGGAPAAARGGGGGGGGARGGNGLGGARGGDGDERGRADHVLHGVELLARVEGLERVVALDPPAVVVQLVHQAHAVEAHRAEPVVGAAGVPSLKNAYVAPGKSVVCLPFAPTNFCNS